MVHFTNIVLSSQLGCFIDLHRLCSQQSSIRYDPRHFSAVIWQHRRIKGCCLVFSNGKIICNGPASSLEEAKQRLRRYARLIQRAGWNVNLQKCRVVTMSCFHQLSAPLNFDQFVIYHKDSYHPEIFPAAMFHKDKVHFTCFPSGKLLITGVKSTRDISNIVYPTIIELELLTL